MEQKQKEKHETIAVVKNEETTEIRKFDIFNLVEHNGTIKIALGNTIVSSKEYKSFEEAQKAIKNKDWELLINAVAFCIEMSNAKK